MTYANHRNPLAAAAAVLALLGLAACEQAKSASPLSPSIAGPIAGVVIDPPPPVNPAQNQKIKDSEQPLAIQFRNGESNGVRPLTHTIQIATDVAFTLVTYSQSNIAPSTTGVVRLVMPAKLQAGRVYYWRTRAEDGANSSAWSDPVRFEILQPIIIGVPNPISPVGNVRITGTSAQLRVQNGVSSGPFDPLRYYYQAARDSAFTQLVANDSVPQGSGETAFSVNSPATDIVIYWRTRISDGSNTGAWSRTESYRTALPVAAPTPPPGGGGGGAPCNSSDPEQIVICERAKYGQMSNEQMLTMMRAVATSLNRNNIPFAPFGILRKTGGHNCSGYSCDVICAGNGSSQRQWDVLGDIESAQTPKWSGPLPTIRVDVCDAP